MSASASATAARSAATAASTSATGAALAARIWVHSPVSPAAIRVTSRSPWPARDRAPSLASASRAAMAADSTCGACETRATHRSCSATLTSAGSAPQVRARAPIAVRPSAGTGGPGQMTQGRPRNRSARAAAGPDRSRPDSGCPGTNVAMSQPAALACRTGRAFTLATSVYQRASPACLRAGQRRRHGLRGHGEYGHVGRPAGRRSRGHITGEHRTCPDVGGQPGRGRIGVGQPHGHPAGPQGERDRGPDQPGPDHDDAGR